MFILLCKKALKLFIKIRNSIQWRGDYKAREVRFVRNDCWIDKKHDTKQCNNGNASAKNNVNYECGSHNYHTGRIKKYTKEGKLWQKQSIMFVFRWVFLQFLLFVVFAD